jgi:hypothetical protein
VPDIDPFSLPDGVRADGPSADPGAPPRAVAFSAWTKALPVPRPALTFEALKWLVLRSSRAWGAYGGIPTALTPAFFRRIDQAEPIAVLRAHLEPAPKPAPGRGDEVLVALCSFAPAGHGTPRRPFAPHVTVWPRLVNELVCDPADYVRVARGTTMLADWSPEEFEILKLYGMHATAVADPPEALPEGTAGRILPSGAVEVLETPPADGDAAP